MVQEQINKAKISSASVAYIQNGQISYRSYGDYSANEFSLYQIGSTTKAFTALGILLLEDENILSLHDPVSEYIPWFAVKYNGEYVPNEDLTIANLLYQNSGFINDETKYPIAQQGMTLEDSIKALIDCELVSYPSSRYAYANANYNILGLVIEAVSGQSYQEFMDENILMPLGLENTYANPVNAIESGMVTHGSRLTFFNNYPYDFTINIASVPAGYILSNTHDMSRWLQIQMGLVEVPDQFKRIIARSHQPNKSFAVSADDYYASGWFVRSDGVVYHSGGTPNYSARVMFDPDTEVGVCVLTNMNVSANTKLIAENIMSILQGDEPQHYKADIWSIIDNIFSILTLVCIPFMLLTMVLFTKTIYQMKRGMRTKKRWTKRSTVLIAIPTFFVLFSMVVIMVLPVAFGMTWMRIGVWAPYSVYTGTISLLLFSVSWFIMAAARNIWGKNMNQDDKDSAPKC